MFKDRADAGERLGIALERFRGEGAVVLAIPRGGVEVGVAAARHIGAEFGVLIAQKLGHPHNAEAAIGAIAEDGSIFYTRLARTGLPIDHVRSVVERERQEIRRRVKIYRHGHGLPVIKYRTVILVDDGIATGATLSAAIMLCKKMKARRIVVAVPVAADSIIRELRMSVDEMIVLEHSPRFYSIAHGYHAFFHVSDEDVVHLLHEAEMI